METINITASADIVALGIHCKHCSKLLDDTTPNTKIGDGYVCSDCLDDKYTYVDCCREYVLNDDTRYCRDEDITICTSCIDDGSFIRCAGCDEYFRDSNVAYHEGNESYYCDSCYPNDDEDEDDDDDSGSSASGYINSSTYSLPNLPKLEQVAVSLEVSNHLARFYGRSPLKTVGKFRDVDAKGTISLPSELAAKVFRELADDFRDKYSSEDVRVSNRYTYAKYVGSDGDKIIYSVVDNVGNKKTVKERLNSIADYYKTRYDISSSYKPSELVSNDFSVSLSNSDASKLAQGRANEEHTWSCQVRANRTNYAKGYYDFYNNGALAVITIKKGESIVGRQVVRFMVDEQGNEYALLDRLYKTGALACNYDLKKLVYCQVFSRLASLYNVAISRESSHDDSVYSIVASYIKDKGIKLETPTASIRTPKRKLGSLKRAYYHDSYSKTYKGADGYVYDYINKDTFYIINKID